MNNLESEFLLDPNLHFLNYGSFGACPKDVFEVYQNFQRELEYQPVAFITTKLSGYLKHSRDVLANYCGALPQELVYVVNPSYAVNLIAKSIDLKVGDEVLTTNLEYGACEKTWDFYAEKKGFTLVKANIQLPILNKEQVVNDFFKGFTKNTKAIFISQITSTTALILPIKEICQKAKSLGLITIVDGAHVPGHIELNLSALDVDFYTGACHKWLLTPKGSSFLYAKKDKQSLLEPLVVSWGYNADLPSDSLFLDHHEMQGTRDVAAFLCIEAALNFRTKHQWQTVSETCRAWVQEFAPDFCKLLNTSALCTISDEFLGQMFSIPIKTTQPLLLKKTLLEDYKIEIPVMVHKTGTYLRYSLNGFNTRNNLVHLYDSLHNILHKATLLEI